MKRGFCRRIRLSDSSGLPGLNACTVVQIISPNNRDKPLLFIL